MASLAAAYAVLASALDIPLRERNTLLLSAGFAPVYRETALDAPAMAHVRAAITLSIDHFPAPLRESWHRENPQPYVNHDDPNIIVLIRTKSSG